MEKVIKAFILAIGTIMLLPFIALFGGTIFYFLWNYLAPIYFASFLQPQFLHLPWWHAVCLLWLFQILNPFKSVSASSKD